MGNDIEEIESKFRHALETIELAQPCVLMIDEIEKAFIGRDNSHNEIILRLLETFLTSMRERKLAVYVIATANDTLPPELMLNGLFDSVYFVDYPNKIEAESILRKCIDRYYDASFYDWSEINNSVIKEIVNLFFADKCNGFSGAEISSLVGTVAETAFRDLIVSRNIQKNSSLDKHKIIIKKELFFSATHEKRPYVMSNQLNDDKIESRIIRISRLKRDFTLKSASK